MITLTYAQHAKPEPIVWDFVDSTGVAINLTGYTASAILVAPDRSETTKTATVTDAALGRVQVATITYSLPGTYYLTVWTGNGTNRFESERISIYVTSRSVTVPSV